MYKYILIEGLSQEVVDCKLPVFQKKYVNGGIYNS